MSKPVIYLSGTIDGLTKEDAIGWRQQTKSCYPFYDYRDPTRSIFGVGEPDDKLVVLRDKFDIQQSDVVLVNLTQYSAGTVMEIMVGHMLHKMVLIVNSMGIDDKNISAWVRYHSTKIVPTIHDAMIYIGNIYAHIDADQAFPA